MVRKIILNMGFLIALSQTCYAQSAMSWSCEGKDLSTDLNISFNLVLADHDGKEYIYQAMEKFIYDGEVAENVDLTITKVSCGEDDEGKAREGVQYWDINNGIFNLYLGCENESMIIQANCNEQYKDTNYKTGR